MGQRQKGTQAEIKRRQSLVMRYYLAGFNASEILASLKKQYCIKVSEQTIFRDLQEAKQYIKNRWAAENEFNFNLAMAKRQAIEKEAWTLYANVNNPMQKLAALDRVIKNQSDMEKIMGLEPIEKQEKGLDVTAREKALIVEEALSSLPLELREQVFDHWRSDLVKKLDAHRPKPRNNINQE